MTDRAPSDSDHAPRPAAPYQVLARKYRPQAFAALIGQDAMVRTLSNAIRENRLAHAFILTGVRGIGKTTTARIIARALNCVGADGHGGPTVEPCGTCEHCRAIAGSRHVDVLEMDAASRTGVDDIRELLDGVRYLPVSARFKIYIVDEVHMLSRNAFNALLKTLEEPPGHVKFVFATTEVRKVPVTVLSRCQRFDLRRVPADLLIGHLRGILAQEGAEAEDEALTLIARAAEGSVRDGLSLLDQALAHGGGRVSAAQVREMLGLADRARVLDLFDAVMRGEAAGALALLRELYDLGAEPGVVLEDMAELTHWLTRLKVVPESGADPTLPELERTRGAAMAEALSLPVLARCWQMLLKGLGEVRAAPAALAAAEMVLVRLAYSADLPTPAEVIRGLRTSEGPAAPAPRAAPERSAAGPSGPGGGPSPPRGGGPAGAGGPAPARASAPDPEPEGPPRTRAEIRDFADLIALVGARREALLHSHLRQNVHLVRFEPGRLEFRPSPHAPADLAQTLGRRLQEWTGERWVVTVNSGAQGAPTVAEREAAEQSALLGEVAEHPLVRSVLEIFPEAEIAEVRPLGGGEASSADKDEKEQDDG